MPDQKIPAPPASRWQRVVRRRELVARVRAWRSRLTDTLRSETRATSETDWLRAAHNTATARQALAATYAELAGFYREGSTTRGSMQDASAALFEQAADWLAVQKMTEQARRLGDAYLLQADRSTADLTCVTAAEVTR